MRDARIARALRARCACAVHACVLSPHASHHRASRAVSACAARTPQAALRVYGERARLHALCATSLPTHSTRSPRNPEVIDPLHVATDSIHRCGPPHEHMGWLDGSSSLMQCTCPCYANPTKRTSMGRTRDHDPRARSIDPTYGSDSRHDSAQCGSVQLR